MSQNLDILHSGCYAPEQELEAKIRWMEHLVKQNPA